MAFVQACSTWLMQVKLLVQCSQGMGPTGLHQLQEHDAYDIHMVFQYA